MKQIKKEHIISMETIAETYNLHPELFRKNGILINHSGFIHVDLIKSVLKDIIKETKSSSLFYVTTIDLKNAFKGILEK